MEHVKHKSEWDMMIGTKIVPKSEHKIIRSSKQSSIPILTPQVCACVHTSWLPQLDNSEFQRRLTFDCMEWFLEIVWTTFLLVSHIMEREACIRQGMHHEYANRDFHNQQDIVYRLHHRMNEGCSWSLLSLYAPTVQSCLFYSLFRNSDSRYVFLRASELSWSSIKNSWVS